MTRISGAALRSLAFVLLAGLAGGALAGCGKADAKKCEQMCRNYATISFRDVEAAKLPPEKREAALAEKLKQGMEFCVNKCRSANNDEQIDCAIAAKSISDLRACD